MPDQDRAIDLARGEFAAGLGVDPQSIQVGSVTRQLIPNPPLGPGEVSINPVRYRYFIELRAGNVARRFRVEKGEVHDA